MYLTSAHVATDFVLTTSATTPNNWIALGGGEWTTAGNWSAGVPTATQDVAIPFLGGGTTINISSTLAALANSVTAEENVRMQASGTFTVNAASTFTRGLSLSSGTVVANGHLDVHGSSTLSAGTTISGGGAYANSADGTVTMSGSLTLNGTIANAGSFTQTAGQLGPAFFAAFINQPGGTYNQQSTVNPSITGSGSFLNSGTFVKTGAGPTGVPATFFNQLGGVVQVQGGTLDLTSLGAGGTTHRGTFDVASGATARWTNGRANFAAGASFTGAGAVEFSPGTINVYADVSGTNVRLIGATLTTTRNFTWTGSNSAFNNGNIAGWGSVTNTGTLGIAGSGSITGRLNNQGIVNWTTSSMGGVGTFANMAGAYFEQLRYRICHLCASLRQPAGSRAVAQRLGDRFVYSPLHKQRHA